ALEQSLVELTRRHDALRTQFGSARDQAVAIITPAAAVASCLVIEDLAADVEVRSARARALLVKKAELRVEQEAWTPFDIARAPLFRARLLRLGRSDHVLLLVFHHIIVDGWSIGIVFEEVAKLYAAGAKGRRPRVSESAVQFPDVACWQRRWCTTAAATHQVAYWKRRLRAASPVFATAAH